MAIRHQVLVALDLNSGRIAWQVTQPLRPLIAMRDDVVALLVEPARPLSLVVLDNAGATICASVGLSIPDWIEPWSDDFALDTSATGDLVLIDWCARGHYRGGAAPSDKILKQAAREAAGRWRLDPRTCAVEPEDRSPSSAASDAQPPAQTSGSAPLAPDVLEQRKIRNHLYQLALRSGDARPTQTVLRALDARTGKCLWESVIDEAPSRQAAPLRQAPATPGR